MSTDTRRPTTAAALVISRPGRAETLTSSWENRSACYNRPQEWWDGEDPKLTEKARAVCLSCPVLAQCIGEQMRLEESQLWSRSAVRGGLTGPERIQLCIDQRMDGWYDAEEARLLALEAGAYAKPVAEIAEDGVSVTTIRLAARMAGEQVAHRKPLKAMKGTEKERALLRAEDIMKWREENVSRDEIARTLGVGRAAVDIVIRTYSKLVGDAAAESDASRERRLLEAYLDGESVILSHDQQVEAVALGVSRGMSYLDIDRAQGLAPNTIAQFVLRARKRYERAGREFPVKVASPRVLKDVDVVAMRELYAQGGVTDAELGLKFGVPRNVVSNALSGRSYKNVGGPIRAGRSARGLTASREYMCGHANNSQAALEQHEIGEAA